MDAAEFLTELALALREYRYLDIRDLTDRIDPSGFTLSQIKKTLALMRRKRRFADMERVASIFIASGHSHPVIRRQWAQALLDQNRITQALRALEDLSAKHGNDPVEGPEIRGLIGRAYKQQYINQHHPEDLRSAISAYSLDWQNRTGDYRWQGINIAALAARAQRDNIQLAYDLDPAKIAGEIFADIDDQGVGGIWDYATAMEACVARGNKDAALVCISKYLHHPDADAFELGSTLRQLKEVWQLEKTPLGQVLLPPLEFAALQKEGATVEQPLQPKGELKTEGFEAVWGDENIVYLQWLDSLYERCNAIARISNGTTGRPEGTGFLVAGGLLNPVWAGRIVLLTNSHVISQDPADRAPLRPQQAVAEFTRLPGRPKIKLGELLFSSPRFALDVSILAIDMPGTCYTLAPCADLPKIDPAKVAEQRIYVIGHPGGQELAVSLYDNSLAEYEKHYIRYRSPTIGGNSGSPVFTRQLDSIALHHRAIEEKKLNEGIVLNEIRIAILSQPVSAV
ncbi:Trypsin-like peptidase domain-containing protein [Nitrosospira multiformis]|uniref:Serine protease n=1 Tax=Nitrosospira multiformis TaxID=1231 RepID=A0A1H8G4P4_9PROT|nr:serine protease [Nitrosospira multiformis]SEN38962.1 Trypsin-like peptidase domain-containing protein [Nitrosospira multiformis]